MNKENCALKLVDEIILSLLFPVSKERGKWEVVLNGIRLFVFLVLQPIVVGFSQPVAGFSLLVFRGFLITYNDAPQSVGLLWTSDQSVAETST